MSEDYASAVNEALGRLSHAGFFFGDSGFVMHAPMGAEALATLGFCNEVPRWVDWYVTVRDIHSPPAPVAGIDPASEADWRSALGQASRLADWVVLFRRQIDDLGWQSTLTAWWPRLMAGMLGGLTHGLIRTAHAIRSVASAPEPSELQLRELANGLASWAGMYQPVAGSPPRDARFRREPATQASFPGRRTPADAGAADAELSVLTARCARRCTALRPGVNPVPLIHTITAPAALRMALPHVPPEFAGPSCRAITEVCESLFRIFPQPAGPVITTSDPAEHERLILEAVELRDEHGIKLAEAATREYRANPDPCYFAAASHALKLLRLSA